jgi:hypothetical protein
MEGKSAAKYTSPEIEQICLRAVHNATPIYESYYYFEVEL